MTGLGDRRRPAWKWSERPGEVPAGRMDLLTHDGLRYADELLWRERRPELAMGPGSWGLGRTRLCLDASARAAGGARKRSRPRSTWSRPDCDKLVDFGAIERAVRRLPRGEVFIFGAEARHEILREVDAVRDLAIEAIDGFLATIVARKGTPSR